MFAISQVKWISYSNMEAKFSPEDITKGYMNGMVINYIVAFKLNTRLGEGGNDP